MSVTKKAPVRTGLLVGTLTGALLGALISWIFVSAAGKERETEPTKRHGLHSADHRHHDLS